MIIVDIETSGGLNPEKIGIWQIGALEFENPSNTFLQEARIDDNDLVDSGALKVIGKTEKELRDSEKQSQKKLLENFFNWAGKIGNKILVAHNAPFDYGFLSLRAKKYDLKFPFSHRSFDLHSLAALKYFHIHGKFLVEDGNSKMNLPKVIEFCGMKDTRIQMKDWKVVQEGTAHNGLEDAKLEAECLSRILYGKNLFREYSHFSIPDYLKD